MYIYIYIYNKENGSAEHGCLSMTHLSYEKGTITKFCCYCCCTN